MENGCGQFCTFGILKIITGLYSYYNMAKDTKQKILDAALKLFSEKGFASVSVLDVAVQIGLTRTTVNHHYKTKELLYQETLKFAVKQVLPSFKVLVKKQFNTEGRILLFISKYIKVLQEYPYLSSFLIYAINNATLDIALLEDNINLDLFYKKINYRIKQGTMTKISPQYVLILILSLCSYPAIGQKLTSLSVGIHPDVYDSFLSEQTNIVTDFVLRGLGLNPLN
jgi:TetR/AcrR family transcriptional regulator